MTDQVGQVVSDELSAEDFHSTAAAIIGEVGKVIVGQDDVVRHVLICVIAGGHALLEGVPGLGKTSLIRTMGDVLDLRFSRIQFTPDMMPADVTGTNIMDEGDDGGQASQAANGARIVAMGNLARKVPIPSHVSDYVARLIIATHPDSDTSPEMVRQYVRYGSSPRGGQALIIGAKIYALLDGRYNVSFDDMKAVAPAALRHRLLLNFEGQAEGITTDQVITDLLAKLPQQ